jgi:orotate phosphoribosyltransferase-like protein
MNLVSAATLPELHQEIYYRFARDYNWSGVGEEAVRHMLELCDAMWHYEHEIGPKWPHAIMRDGHHTGLFVDCMQALKETSILRVIAQLMVQACNQVVDIWDMGHNDWVIGAERAGAPIAQAVASILGCRHATTEKDDAGDPTKFDRFTIGDDELVLVVNDLLSHPDGSTNMIGQAIRSRFPKAKILPVCCHLVNRSGVSELIDGTPVLALLTFERDEESPDNCRYCQGGSPPMKFKARRDAFFNGISA